MRVKIQEEACDMLAGTCKHEQNRERAFEATQEHDIIPMPSGTLQVVLEDSALPADGATVQQQQQQQGNEAKLVSGSLGEAAVAGPAASAVEALPALAPGASLEAAAWLRRRTCCKPVGACGNL